MAMGMTRAITRTVVVAKVIAGVPAERNGEGEDSDDRDRHCLTHTAKKASPSQLPQGLDLVSRGEGLA
jgi:hypothetical protein